jgi:hypothetical protein
VTIERATALVVFATALSCGSSSPAPDASGNSSEDARSIPLPDGFAPATFDVDFAAVYANTCHCSVIASPCPDGGSDCVICQASSLSCSECPRPYAPPAGCQTIGLACDYDEGHCACVAGEDGSGFWSCHVCPC